MDTEAPTREEWVRLFEAMIAVKALAPWQWMGEADLFGVQDPASGQVYYVSVMGELGEHFAIAAYPGEAGLSGFWAMHQGILNEDPDVFFLVPQLQASFEDRSVLSDKDRELIKELGYKFRGKQAWPRFRSHRPGFLPWYLDAAEARALTLVLEQVLDVAPRFREDRRLLAITSDATYLVRVARKVDDTLVWEDRRMKGAALWSPTITLQMDLDLLARLKRLPHSGDAIEVGIFMLPMPVREAGFRPFFPFELLVVHARNGMILGQEMLDARSGIEAMWGKITESVAKILARYQAVPRSIRVDHPLLEALLQPLAEELGVDLKRMRRLPALSEAKEALLAFLQR